MASSGPSASPAASFAGNLTLQDLAARAPDAEKAYADLLERLRRAAGLMDGLGAAAPATYSFVDASEATVLKESASKVIPGIGFAGHLASATRRVEPTTRGLEDGFPVVFTAWMFTTMLATFPDHDNGHGSGGSMPTDKHTFTSTDNGITTSTEVTTDVGGLSFDGNNEAVTMTVAHATTVTDANGKVISHLTGKVTSSVRFQGCPASDGLILGEVKFTVEEGSPDAAAGGAYAKTTTEEDVHLYVGEDAWLTRKESAISTDLSIRGGIAAAGQAPGVANDWDSNTAYTLNFVSPGPPTSSSGSPDWKSDPARPSQSSTADDFRTVADQGAADKTIHDAVVGSAFVTGLPMLYISDSAQKYWRNGNCVEVAVVQGNGGDVEPGQEVQIVAQPRHKIDHVDLAKPVVAAFSGEASASPLGVAVAAPASFDFTASDEEHVRGTVTLTSTSNRGIGTASPSFYTEKKETPTPSPPPTTSPPPTARPRTPPPLGTQTPEDWRVQFDGALTEATSNISETEHHDLVVHSDVIALTRQPNGHYLPAIGSASGEGSKDLQGANLSCHGKASGSQQVQVTWHPETDANGQPILVLDFIRLLDTGEPAIETLKLVGTCTDADGTYPMETAYDFVVYVFPHESNVPPPIKIPAVPGSYPFAATYDTGDGTLSVKVTVTLSLP